MENKNYAYILGTVHIKSIKRTKTLETAMKECTDRLIDYPPPTNLFALENIIREPFVVLGYLIYASIVTAIFSMTRTSDTKSLNKLTREINPNLKNRYLDVPISELISVFHKRLNYAIDAIILVSISVIVPLHNYIPILYFVVAILFYFVYFVYSTLDYRNKRVAENTLKLISEGKIVLIQFGKSHRKGITEYLEKNNVRVIQLN